MDSVKEKAEELIQALEQSEDFIRYRNLENQLKEMPELRQKINEYRRKVYDMQTSGRDLYDETDYVLNEYSPLLRNEIAADYLDAESAVCRMVQRVINAINREVHVEVPM
ncbi:YlbF family regulator [Bilifractor sp. LCP21S3_A7]|uniref:YlbF family regulator n=1 Tax=Bilifractor sp. LCP21S3_A7 TaxID=3438738 RepID=UPI003F8EF407